jgi:hypothetical protein
MDHAEAVRTKAAERYLLGEMSPRVREEYEEHFFGCVECAQDVQRGAAFVDAARDVLGSETISTTPAKPERKPSLWAWILRPAYAIPVMALLLAIVGYQNLRTIPQMRSELAQATTPQSFPSLSLINANSRGGELPEITVAANKPFGLFVDIPPAPRYGSYVCAVEEYRGDVAGAVKFSVTVSEEEAKQTVQLMIPAFKLAAGKYAFVVQGYESLSQQKVDVARYPFVLNVSR